MHQWLNCSSYSLFSRVTVWTWYLSASDKGQSSGPRVSPLFIRSWFMMPISIEDLGAVFPTHNVPLLHWHCGGRSKATENHAENWGHYCIIRSFPIFIQVVPSFLQQCKCTIARKEETDLYLVRNSDTTLHITPNSHQLDLQGLHKQPCQIFELHKVLSVYNWKNNGKKSQLSPYPQSEGTEIQWGW